MSDRSELEAALEALLFVAGEPVSEQRLLAIFDEEERDGAALALAGLRERYRAETGRGVFLEEVAGGLRIVTAPDMHPYLKKFFAASGTHRLSMAALETLAIVAYRQPVTGPEIQELRGKNPSAALKTLLERRLLRITGRKDVVGRPFLYATTREFLMHFGLRNLGELPPLEEFEETFGADAGEAVDNGVAEVPISHEHESMGLVSMAEAEATLGTAGYDLHEPSAGVVPGAEQPEDADDEAVAAGKRPEEP